MRATVRFVGREWQLTRSSKDGSGSEVVVDTEWLKPARSNRTRIREGFPESNRSLQRL